MQKIRNFGQHSPVLQKILLFCLIIGAFGLSSCTLLKPADRKRIPVVLQPLNEADEGKLFAEVNRLAKINSIRGKLDVSFEDNSFAESGIAEKYKTANGDVAVQRPGNIYLKIEAPFVNLDIAQMTSNGKKFCIAILQGSEKIKRFVCGTNNADYSKLQEKVSEVTKNGGTDDKTRKTVSALASLRPQHFTDALLMQPIEENKVEYSYIKSEIFQEEDDPTTRKSVIARVIRGYYLLDEMKKDENNGLFLTRRFWFDRVGGIRLARLQIFQKNGKLEADIAYGAEKSFTEKGDYTMPVRVEVTRWQEKYKMSLTYQAPEAVVIGRVFPSSTFELQNKWNLPEMNLDDELTKKLASVDR
jgi:hypothetical protein